MLEPADSSECKDYIIRALEISENYDCPVIIRLSTRIAHSQSVVELGDKSDYEMKDYVKDINKYVMMPAMARKRHAELEKKMEYLTEYSQKTDLNQIMIGNRDIGIITSGISYQYAREAFGNVSYLKLGMVYPISETLIRTFAKQVKNLYVVEELEPFIENIVKEFGIKVIGKSLLPKTGELSVQILREEILNRITEEEVLINDVLPPRPPVMCAGCPHRGMFYVLKKMKLVVSGDIGCYTLGALAPTEAMDTCVCMGASIGMVHGMQKARGKSFAKKSVAVLGDSTFIHSGITGLIDVVYNKGTSTVIILDNSITGMTGHQDNPSTGLTIKKEPTKQTDFIKLCNAIGIDRVTVVDPFNIKEFERVLNDELSTEEP
jgi:indolepyruvate ferredoxin oxidoreductase alpha subunit